MGLKVQLGRFILFHILVQFHFRQQCSLSFTVLCSRLKTKCILNGQRGDACVFGLIVPLRNNNNNNNLKSFCGVRC